MKANNKYTRLLMCSKLTINDAIRQLTTTIKMMMYLL